MLKIMSKNRRLLGFMGVVLLSCVAMTKMKQKRVRRYKTRPINRQRNTQGAYNYFLKMKHDDPEQFFKYTRMTVPMFDYLLSLIAAKICRSKRSDGICAQQRLAITLQYLSQGGSMQSIAWAFQIGLTTVQQIIHQTNEVLWDVLSPIYLQSPSSEEEWRKISDGFYTMWNFPNCIGALDGKHINIQAPANSGSLFFNYKKNFSIILLATCDSNYLFTMVDIGAYGSQSDGGVFRNSIFGERLEANSMNVPAASRIENTNVTMPYVIVADEAFPLKQYIMRPYPGKNLTVTQRIFNYRLSRARRTIENTFGILVARWRVLKQSICAKVENIDNIVKATVVLHNFCKREFGDDAANNNWYCPPGYTDVDDADNGLWRTEAQPLASVGRLAANNATRLTYGIRDTLANYFVSPTGQLPWQEERVMRGTLA